MNKRYKLGEEFLEITFQVPRYRHSLVNVVENILTQYPDAVNVTAIPCKIIKEPSRLSVSKANSSYTIWNAKGESKIIESDKEAREDEKE